MTESQKLGRAASGYEKQEVLGESPVALVARLYDMARLEISRARAALAKKDWGAKGTAVHRAMNCLSLLQCSLDLKSGGDVAANLDRVYAYLVRRLCEAHVRNDETIFEEIVDHLAELGTAWRQISDRHRAHGIGASGGDPAAAETATP